MYPPSPSLNRVIFSRAVLAFTVGLFLSCAAKVSGAQEIDRTARPAVPPAAPARIPAIQMRRLANGIEVAVLENHEIPAVSVAAIVDAPALLEPAGKSGLASLTAAMLNEGTQRMSADEMVGAFADLGNTVSPSGFFTVTRNVGRSLELMSDLLRRPSFPADALERQKANRITALRRQKDQPGYIAGRVLAQALYGADHPYNRPPTEESTAAIAREDLLEFHSRHYHPANVRFVVAGDITPESAVAKLERAFGDWQPSAERTRYSVPPVKPHGPTTIYLYDRPGSPQSIIALGQPGPPRDTPDYDAIELLNTVIGGAFNSRLNLNLRERHGFAYGAGSGFTYRRKPEPGEFIASAAVATPKTDSALVEMLREVREVRDSRPVTEEELAFARATATRGLPLEFETVEQIGRLGATVLRNELPIDYYQNYVARVTAVTAGHVQDAAMRHLNPERMAIVVVGDRKLVEPGLRATGIAPVIIIGENGEIRE